MQNYSYPMPIIKYIYGAIGKKYVVKHYGKKVVVTRYPDMTNIKASSKQQKQRDHFKEAVAYAKEVIADPVRKAAWQKKLKDTNRLFNVVIRNYFQVMQQKHNPLLLQPDDDVRLLFKNTPYKELERLVEIAKAA